MKYLATNDKVTLEIEVTNVPTMTCEEVIIAHPEGNRAFVHGAPTWNRLEINSDVSALIDSELEFTMKTTEWTIENCRVCEDRKTIFFRNAINKFK